VNIYSYTYDTITEAANYILNRTPLRPKIGIILGSGLGSLVDCLENKIEFPYENIPHFPDSTVPGHAGKLVVGMMGSVPVLCMQGRFHFYEGTYIVYT
jgi:purine-nucleoside phosphorylase